MKNVISIYGHNCVIDEAKQKIHNYDNEKKKIIYNAEVIKDGKNSGFYTDYVEKGTIEDIETRLNTWNNPVKLAYAAYVNFNASENDPDRVIWGKYVEYVKKHEGEFFTKSGNWKKRIRAARNRMELEIVDNITNL